MKEKTEISLKTKKILTGVGIGFGTILVFVISFTLAFSLIVNPINLFTFKDGDTLKENAQLKEQVQSLTDEIEVLNTTVEKYKANQSAPAIVQTPDTTAQQTQPQATDNTPEASQNTDTGNAQQPESDSSSFSPETVTGTDTSTPEDVEAPVTVIDVSE